MRKLSAVIGANFGDEGKGLITDYLSSPDTVVVRFNGGAQAGHTVVTPSGGRHVFHHIGAGHFRGAKTWLSRYFVVNPAFLKKEIEECSKYFADDGRIHCDTEALVTTPWDMLVNQFAEIDRDKERHGSCGAGVWETMVRGNTMRRLTVADLLLHKHDLSKKLDKIVLYCFERLEYLTDKLGQLQHLVDLFWSKELHEEFLASCEFFLDYMRCYNGSYIANTPSQDIVFEGAQGLLLDADHHFFPYVSATKTGLTNVIKLCGEANISGLLQVHYVTRSYMTRHGPGPFPTETKFTFPDKTNTENQWQGKLRFGTLDRGLMYETIKSDYNKGYALMARENKLKLGILPYIAVTHMDQSPTEEIPYQLSSLLDIPVSFKSYGPTRDDVVPVYKCAHEMSALTSL